MRRAKFKLLSVFMIVCIVLQMVASMVAFAGDEKNLTGDDTYLCEHNLSGSYDKGGNSSIKVLDTDNSEIEPEGNKYSDVPAGAKINLRYVFNLEEGDETSGDTYEYTDENYFYINLPEGITFVPKTGEIIVAHDDAEGDYDLAEWGFEDENTIKVKFLPDVVGKSSIWGAIEINGTFNAVEEGDDEDVILTIGGDEVTFSRVVPEPPAPTKIELEKHGEYDAENNEITWTVTVTPPEDVDLEGYELVDEYSDNQVYVPGSFEVGVEGIDDSDLDLTTANTIIYTFEADTTGEQTITYKTKPNDFSDENGTKDSSEFSNKAVVKYDGDEVSDPKSDSVTTDWISKSGSTISSGRDSAIIKWTVTVNVPGDASITGATITDTIPEGLKLMDEDGHKVTININNSGEETAVYGYDYTDSDTESTLTYTFTESISGTSTLTYYTEVSDYEKYFDNNGNVTFSNDAELNWTGMPGSDGPKDQASASIVGDGGLLSKTGQGDGNYNYNGYTHWIVTINRNGITIPDASVKDDLEEGQKLQIDADHPFTVKKNNEVISITNKSETSKFTSDDGFEKNFTYDLGTIEDKYTIDYYSKVVDTDDFYDKNNENIDLKNTTILYKDNIIKETITGNKQYSSQTIQKSVDEEYNFSDHTVKWKLVVNRNELPMTNAKIEDEIENGMVLIIDEDHPFKVEDSDSVEYVGGTLTGETNDTEFTYEFVQNIDEEYTITYYTKLTDTELANNFDNKTFKNESTLFADEIKNSGIYTYATVNVKHPTVTKTYKYENNADYVDWSVVINQSKIKLSNAKVTDKLDAAFELDTDSIKLYEVDINEDGTVASCEDGTLVTSGCEFLLPNVDNDNTLTVKLPDESDSVYRLEFTTNIVGDSVNCENEVSLTGAMGSPTGMARAARIAINDLWSNGGSGNLKLTVHKEDGKENPVEGAVYRLLNAKGNPIKKGGQEVTAETNDNGDAVFENLPSWTFYAQEVTPPNGYLLNTEVFGGSKLTTNLTYKTDDMPAVGVVEFSKTADNGDLVNGGEFTLSGTDYDGANVTLKSASVDGVVKFENVPLGSYTVSETKAPSGYYVTDETLAVTVEYNDDKTDVEVTVTPGELENQVMPSGVIRLKKTDSNGKALVGAEFGLYDASDDFVKSATSGEDGVVIFEKVLYGTYTIREISAPNGYKVSDVEATAVVSEQTKDVKASPYLIVNYLEDEDVPDKSDGKAIIRIKKIDRSTKKVLSGAEFTIYDSDENVIDTVVSDGEGMAVFKNIEPGKYTIKETSAPKGYKLSDNQITLFVEENRVYEYTIANTSKPSGGGGGYELPKKDKDKPNKPETPVTPGTETPVTPGTETPVTPGTETPVIPGTETPVTPGTETPVIPGTETPTIGENNSTEPNSSEENGSSSNENNKPSGKATLPKTGGLLDTSTLIIFGTSLIALGIGTAYMRWRKRS